jgi:hypothetical protein
MPNKGAVHIGSRGRSWPATGGRPRCIGVSEGVPSCAGNARFHGNVGRVASSRLARAAAEASGPCKVGSWLRGMVAGAGGRATGEVEGCGTRTTWVVVDADCDVEAVWNETGTGGSVAERLAPVVSPAGPCIVAYCAAASAAALARRAASKSASGGLTILMVLTGGGAGLPAAVGSPAGRSGGRVCVRS